MKRTKKIRVYMRRIKKAIALCSLLTFVTCLIIWIIGLILASLFGKFVKWMLLWPGVISFFSWAVFLVASSISPRKMDRNYASWERRHYR